MDINLFNATLEYDLGWGNLLATYSNIDSSALNSSSFSQSNPIWTFSYIQDGKHKEDTGEIRFVSDLSGRFNRSEEQTSELQSLMRISYAVLCLKKQKTNN